jgi:Nucleotidyl transferase AbiEii toxin, Type IV TA system
VSATFAPCTNVLPAAQQALWPQLRPLADMGFVLYGGTAVALRFGHRSSVDFDFFRAMPLDRDRLKAALPVLAASTAIQDNGDAWSLMVPCGDAQSDLVKVSFFGSIAFGRVGSPARTDDGVLMVASVEDLMATKLKVILQRAEAKDYRDIAALLKQARASLARGLAAARLLFGPNLQPSEVLKALVYHADGDLKSLADDDKRVLVEAVGAVGDLPAVALASRDVAIE